MPSYFPPETDFLQFVCTSLAARALEGQTMEEKHVTERQLMNQAAAGCARALEEEFPQARHLLFVLGKGNNANDGLLIAEILHLHHPDLNLTLVSPWPQAERVPFLFASTDLHTEGEDAFQAWLQQYGGQSDALIMDALFGSGLNRELQPPVTGWIDAMNHSDIPCVSIDLPSGLDGTTGKILGRAVQPSLTLALDCFKTGFFVQDGPRLLSRIRLVSVGIPGSLHLQQDPLCFVMNEETAARFLKPRSCHENKGAFGKVLLAGGSLRMQGALAMAAEACFHAGCGTLTLFAPEDAGKAIASKMDLAMIVCGRQDPEGFFSPDALPLLQQQKGRFTWIACGNGIGLTDGSLAVLQELLSWETPMTVDADGITLLARHPKLLEKRRAPLVLTPHLMEFSRLCGRSLDDLKANLLQAALAFCQAHPQVILVLKSDVTLVCHQNLCSFVNRPDSRLSKGGSGDVLCGLTSGLCAWNPDHLYEACCAAAWIHNAAADQPEISPVFFTPHNLIEGFNRVFLQLDETASSLHETAA